MTTEPMRYLVLVHKAEDRPGAWRLPMAEPSPPGIVREMGALCPSSSATTLKLGKGRPVLFDGALAPTREQPAGYYIVECGDLDQAIAWAGRITPAPGCELWVEIRPVASPSS